MINLQDYFHILRSYNTATKDEFYCQAFARNIGILTNDDQAKLAEAKIAIPGMGGVGGVHLITLVRSGVGKFHLADFDSFEPVNINRQMGAKVSTFGRSKLEVMTEEALSINPYLHITTFQQGLHTENVEQFLEGVDLVLDGLDFFAFDTRRLLFKTAKDKGIPVVTAGPLGFGAALLIFHPSLGMGFDEYFDVQDSLSAEEKSLRFALGLAPKGLHFKYMDTKKVDLKAKAGPSTNIACQLCSAIAATECLRIILGRKGIKPVPHYLQFDPYLQRLQKGYLWKGNKNPLQIFKRKYVQKFVLNISNLHASRNLPAPPDMSVAQDQIPEEVIRYLVEIGSWAPSADNCQPWRFSWDGEALSLYNDPDRSGFFYDIGNESTLMTFGAVLENIAIAASNYGLQTSYEFASAKGPASVNLNISLHYSGLSVSKLFAYLPKRAVNRKAYHKTPINEQVQERLSSWVKELQGTELIWFDSPEAMSKLQKIVARADQILFEDKRLHQGLFKWIRLGEGQKRLSPDEGMGVPELELDLMGKTVFPMVKQWPILSALNKLGFSKALGMNSLKLLKQSAAYALITVSLRDADNYLLGGRAMQRFWIAACAEALGVQPMAGFVFLLNHYSHNRAQAFSRKHQKMIKDLWLQYSELVDNQECQVPLMFFRTGYAPAQSALSQRRQLDSIFHKKNGASP